MIIGITGTNGSGKGTVVDYLVTQKGFTHYSVRSFLTTLLDARGIPADRSALRKIANELRQAHEPAYVIKSMYAQVLRDRCERAIIESIRNVGEAHFLKEHDALLIAVDADQRLRYERIQERRSDTDRVDYETFLMHEEREMHPVGPYDMDVRGVMACADITLTNDDSVATLYASLDAEFLRLNLQQVIG